MGSTAGEVVTELGSLKEGWILLLSISVLVISTTMQCTPSVRCSTAVRWLMMPLDLTHA